MGVMLVGYRNHEGYSDPTAGLAFANIRREERQKRKAAARPASPKDTPRRHRRKHTKAVLKCHTRRN